VVAMKFPALALLLCIAGAVMSVGEARTLRSLPEAAPLAQQEPTAQAAAPAAATPPAPAVAAPVAPLVAPCVYINLERRDDRRAQLEPELAKAGLACERIEAMEGRHYPDPQVGDTDEGVLGRGERACRDSHIFALKHLQASLQNSSATFGMVFEDDVMWSQNPPKDLQARIARELEKHPMVLLSCGGEGIDIGELGFRRTHQCWTTSAYVVRKDYLSALMENFEAATKQPIDWNWYSLQDKDNWAMFFPKMMKQRPSYSDVKYIFSDFGV